jgi:hypothetical protein
MLLLSRVYILMLTYNRLSVLGVDNSRRGNGVYWICLCVCGNLRSIKAQNVRKNHTKSCGCLNKETSRQSIKKLIRVPNGTAAFKSLLRDYKLSAFKRNLDFDLTLEVFTDLINSNCVYCDSPPLAIKRATGNTGEYIKYTGIDRRDNTKGYTLDNSVSCCKICNYAKLNMTEQEFYQWINRLHSNLKRKGIL